MSGVPAALHAHLQTGLTTLCRCWVINRADGSTLGFTDHDRDLVFNDVTFRADTGLSASALSQSTGLAVDNAEAVGALTAAAITEADIEAGRFDGADVESWLVNWANVDERWLQFRGFLGEIRRIDGGFSAELRGLSEALNQPQGRVYQKPCTAVLGDGNCRFGLGAPGFRFETSVAAVTEAQVFTWPSLPGFAEAWFARGRFDVLSGDAAGLWSTVKSDVNEAGGRIITLWEPLRAAVAPGDTVRLTAGCDKRMATCRDKFSNLRNFQGFPDLPGEDWQLAVPKKAGVNGGGSRR